MQTLKVTVIVETSERHGHSEQFKAELPGPTGLELSGHAPIYAEQLIAEVGAHLVRKVAAVYGDHRDDEASAAKLPRLRRLRPLTDFDEAREAARRGSLGPPFTGLTGSNSEFARQVNAALNGVRERLEQTGRQFITDLTAARQAAEEKAANVNDDTQRETGGAR